MYRLMKLERFLSQLVMIPHVPEMICLKAFLGIMDQVRSIGVLRSYVCMYVCGYVCGYECIYHVYVYVLVLNTCMYAALRLTVYVLYVCTNVCMYD